MLEEGPLFKTVVSALNEEVGSMLLEVMEYIITLCEVVTAMPRLDTAELEFVAELIIIVEEAICISEVYIVLVSMVSLMVEGKGAGVVLVLSLVVGAVTAMLLGVA